MHFEFVHPIVPVACLLAVALSACTNGLGAHSSTTRDTGTDTAGDADASGSAQGTGSATGTGATGTGATADTASPDVGTDEGIWDKMPPWVSFVVGAPDSMGLAPYVHASAGSLSFRPVGDWPSAVSIDSAAMTIEYDGSGVAGTTAGLRIEAEREDGTIEVSSPFIIVLTDDAAKPTIDYNLAQEPFDGHDGSIFWQSVFLLEDERIVAFGTGNHIFDQTNSVRIIDPVVEPGFLHYDELFPWTKDTDGKNLYVSNYDNNPSMYLRSDNLLLWVHHGVFDVAEKTWQYGDRPPFAEDEGWATFLAHPPGFPGAYNPAVAWCDALNVGVFFGNSEGGWGQSLRALAVVEPNPDYPATASQPWRVVSQNIEGIGPITRARNSAVCVDDQLFVLGPDASVGYQDEPPYLFYQIDVARRVLVSTLAPPPSDPELNMGNSFPQLIYDAARDRLVLLGRHIALYSFADDAWTYVMSGNGDPPDWPGFMHPMGVYHPSQNAVFFRGRPRDFGATPYGYRADFAWNRIIFTD